MNAVKIFVKRFVICWTLFSVFLMGMWAGDVLDDTHVVSPAMAAAPERIVEYRIPEGVVVVDQELWDTATKILEDKVLPIRGRREDWK